MPGTCTSTNFQALMSVLGTGVPFINPLAGILAGIAGTISTAQGCLTAILGNLNPSMIGYAEAVASVTSVQTGCTGFSSASLAPMQVHTDFLSGASQVFPTVALSGVIGSVPNGALIGAMTFTGLLGTVAGGMNSTSALCQMNPSLPCAGVTAVFSTVMGAPSSAITAAASGMAAAQSAICTASGLIAAAKAIGLAALEAAVAAFVSTVSGLLSSIAGLAAGLIAQIVSDLTNLAATILQTLNFGLAKTIAALNINPCFSALLGAIGSPSLIAAIPSLP